VSDGIVVPCSIVVSGTQKSRHKTRQAALAIKTSYNDHFQGRLLEEPVALQILCSRHLERLAYANNQNCPRILSKQQCLGVNKVRNHNYYPCIAQSSQGTFSTSRRMGVAGHMTSCAQCSSSFNLRGRQSYTVQRTVFKSSSSYRLPCHFVYFYCLSFSW
jgi:hypothetical protein